MGPEEHPEGPEARPRSERQRRLRRRFAPLAGIAAAAFVAGAIVAAGSLERDAANRFVEAWAAGDFAAMHAELTEEAQGSVSEQDLAAAYLTAQRTATASAIDPRGASGPHRAADGSVVRVRIDVETDVFGEVEQSLELPVADGRIAWEPHAAFPGLQRGEVLGRRLDLDDRGAILARDGTPLAQGQGTLRTSPVGPAAVDITGSVGRPDPETAAVVQEQGLPPDTDVGTSGLELAFNPVLSGRPGGELLAVPAEGGGGDVGGDVDGRVLARAESAPGEDLQTTIDPTIQEAAVSALAGRAGGIAVLDARNGAVRALAGSAFSVPQPPGSVYKIVTTVAALEDGLVSLDDSFTVTDAVNVGGREIENSEGGMCGGTFAQSFARSCNTVFAPLGPEIGNDRMVEVAEQFGFNRKPTLYYEEATEAIDPPEPQIPSEIGDDLDLGVTAIGQGELLATPLSIASVGQTIAGGGMRHPTPIVRNPELRADAEPVRVTSQRIAGTVRDLMVDVVEHGTGFRAALSGVQVAGKTGTAELGPKPDQPPPEPVPPGEDPPKPEQILDAWFVAFAPARNPRFVVSVMLADSDGDGGEVAAPPASQVLAAALGV